ncbi:MAG: hypothetical protein JWN48_5020 [Myxococcaceae bacterium]|nr:hypothetical protein [Myxococcaceae bacterium]
MIPPVSAEPPEAALFENAFRHAAIGMALVSLNGQFLKVNDSLCALLGYTRAELKALNFQQITHPDDLALDLEHVGMLLDGQLESYDLEKRYIAKWGGVVSILLTASVVRDPSGQPAFFIAQIQDITRQVKARREEAAFFEQSIDLLAIATQAGRLERVNGAWERVLGWSSEELTSRPFLTFVHPDDRAATIRAAEDLYLGLPALGFRNRYEAKDGSYHWLEWNSHPSDDGRIYCVVRHIHAQVHNETVLRLRDSALLAIASGVLITDPSVEGNPIRYCNAAFERITGYSESEVLGRSCNFLQGNDREQPELKRLRAAVHAGRACKVVLRNYRKNGTLFWNELTVAPVRSDGVVTHFVGAIEDITARITAEEDLRKQVAIVTAVFESMTDVVIVVDHDGQVVLLNDVAKELFGPFHLRGGSLQWEGSYGFFLADKVTRCEPNDYPISRALRGERVDQTELWMRMPGWPEGRWHSVSGSPVRNLEGRLMGAVTVGRDVTERKSLEEQARRAALTDELTGLYNRRGFMALGEPMLRGAARYGRGLALLFMDLDGLKEINDRLGHEVGDDLITEAATTLQRCFRGADLLARLGGDEFVVLVEDDDPGARLCRRLLDALRAHNQASQKPFQIELSVGFAHFDPAAPCSLGELLAAADRAMYEQKRARRSSRPAR